MYNKMFIIALSLSLILHFSLLGISFFGGDPSKVVLERQAVFVTLQDREEHDHAAEMNESVSNAASTPNFGFSVELMNSNIRYSDYILSVKRRIEERWSYPSSSFTNGERGVTTVRFSISSSGDLVDYVIVSSSGFPVLDRAALDVICSAAPFGPFPSHMKISRINIVAEFYYGM